MQRAINAQPEKKDQSNTGEKDVHGEAMLKIKAFISPHSDSYMPWSATTVPSQYFAGFV